MLRMLNSLVGLGFMAHALFLIHFRFPPLSAAYHVGVDKVFGELVFLTVQTIVILTVYFSLCIVSEIGNALNIQFSALDCILHRYSCIAGGFGLFLTVAFYGLCWYVLCSLFLCPTEQATFL